MFIGKIEGVYNIGQRNTKQGEETKTPKKTNPNSGTSSDYDKAGGQSSSNVDSGRGSAAYSSGRRPAGMDLNSEYESGPTTSGNKYRDGHLTGRMSHMKLILNIEIEYVFRS